MNGAYLVPSQDICIPSDSCEWGIIVGFRSIYMPSYCYECGILGAFTRYLYNIRLLWMGHTCCHHTAMNGAYLVPSQDICIPSDSCEWGILVGFRGIYMPSYCYEWGILDAFKRYLYATRFLWMRHTWCLLQIVVCRQIPVNGAYLRRSKDICMPSDLCEWCILYTFKRYLYAIKFL
jgi:hypothetical protein